MANKEFPSETEIGEIIASSELYHCVFVSLIAAQKHHQELGEKGREKDVINQFGEQAVRADLEAEQELLKGFSTLSKETGINVEIRGEETGSTEFIGKEDGPKYFSVIDGLDGSSNYTKPSEWPYGTMIAVAKGESPKYKDFVVAGITLPEEDWILLAFKGHGAFIYDTQSDTFTKLKRFGEPEYDDVRVIADNYFPEAKKMLGNMQEFWGRTGSEAASVAAVAIGDQLEDSKYPQMNRNWQSLVDVTRKGNLEQPSSYLILNELGGVMEDKDGNDIGEYDFKTWGQTEKLPLISAKSHNIASRIRQKLTLD